MRKRDTGIEGGRSGEGFSSLPTGREKLGGFPLPAHRSGKVGFGYRDGFLDTRNRLLDTRNRFLDTRNRKTPNLGNQDTSKTPKHQNTKGSAVK